MGVQGESRKYDMAVNFIVEIDGIEPDDGAFETCSEIVDTSAVVEQREGGNKKVASKRDGQQTYEPVTLTRGRSAQDDKLQAWRQAVKKNGSLAEERNVSIVTLDDDGTELYRDNLLRAWPSRYQKGGWDAKAEEFIKEELELQFHDWEGVPQTSQISTT